MPFSDHYYFRSDSPSSNTSAYPKLQDIQSTLEQIDRIANEDIEMQEPPSERTRFLVIDTNVLLDHLEVLKKFVEDVKDRGLPVVLIIPGIVIQELDGQKTGVDRRGKSARQASQWLLAEVQKRQVVKGQANEETCKPSGNWKLTKGEVIRSNDEFITDCCQYYYRQQLRTYLCTADVNLCIGVEIAERDGRIKSIAPPSNERWSSWALLSAIFEDEPGALNILAGRDTGRMPITPTVSEDNSMDVDDSLSPSHPLDRLHEQVVAEFSKLLDELVLRVGGPEIHVADTSIYAPEWRRLPFSKWTPTECLNFLNHKRRVKPSNPEAGGFLRLPHSQTHPRRHGHEWSREAWDNVIGYLTRVGAVWEDAAMQMSLGNLEREVEEVFAMKMRPTGT